MAREPDRWDLERDVVVVGSGSGAMTCAMTAAQRGAKVTMVERAPKLGGGTGYSGGLVWMPNGHRMAEAGLSDSREEALTYVRRISGGKHDEKMLQTFVDTGPDALDYVEREAGFKFELAHGPDYNCELPGGKEDGRCLHPPLFDAKELGDWQDKLIASPHYAFGATYSEILKWGGMDSVLSWPWDILGKRLKEDIRGFGAAYIGYLLKACLAHKVEILLNTRARQLILDMTGRVIGIRAERDGRDIYICGLQGVLLGCGGFDWNEEIKKRMPGPDFKASTVPTNEGDGLMMALKIGAAMVIPDICKVASLAVPGEEHMGKPLYRLASHQMHSPGTILVNRQGKRFADENFHMSVGVTMCFFDRDTQSYPNLPAYMICDQNHKKRYVIGVTMPGDEAPDWIPRGKTLRELAQKLGVDPANLEDTVKRFNGYARKGKDPEFHRGDKIYDRYTGDQQHKPNPCLGPIEEPPFYGLEMQLTTGGTLPSGLSTNTNAQVINLDGDAIPGLYACPNTAAHLALGLALTSGNTNSQSTVFGYIAAQHATR